MANKNLTFEERIKKEQKKQKNRFITKISIIGTLFILLLAYIFTPLSQVSNYHLKGNIYLSSDQVLEICNLKRSSSLFTLNEKKVEDLLNEHPLIDDAKVSTSIFGLDIEIEEKAMIFKYNNNYYLNDNSILDSDYFDSPMLKDFLLECSEKIPVSLNSDETKFTSKIVSDFSKIFFGISEEYREKIEYVKFISVNELSLFYKDSNNKYLELNLNLPNSIYDYDDISCVLDESKFSIHNSYIEEYYNQFRINTHEINQNLQTEFEYYTLKVIIEYEFGTKNVKYTDYGVFEQGTEEEKYD